MAITITDECINCGACEPECPNNAIYEGGAEWKYSDGTSLKGMLTTLDGNDIDAEGHRIIYKQQDVLLQFFLIAFITDQAQ